MPEITKTENSRPETVARYVWILLAILSIVAYFFGLTVPFLGPDESRYAQVAREMMNRGDWITPTLGGVNWFEKPVLLYWLEIASYYLFGVNEFAARFGPALFGLGTIASLWLLGRRLATENMEKPIDDENLKAGSENSVLCVAKNFANYLALIAASTIGILVFAHGASFDIIVTFPMTAALICFYIYDSRIQRPAIAIGSDLSPRPCVSAPLVLFYFFIGVALLAKGLIGIVFPYAIVILFYVLSRRMPNKTLIFSMFWGTLLAVAVAAVWYLPMYLRHGWPFIDEFFIQHHFQRFTSNKYQHPQPFYFFLWVLPLMTLPWLPFFLASIWKNAKGIFHHKGTEGTEIRTDESLRPNIPASQRLCVTPSPLPLFAAAWLVVPLVFFSFSGSKLPGYILPALPAAIIFTAAFVFGLIEKSRNWRQTVIIIAASTFVVSILLSIFALPRFAETDSVRSLIEAANARGYSINRVVMLHTISYNAEFYADGRLVRETNGTQRHFNGPNEVMDEIKAENGQPVVVLIPLSYLPQLMAYEPLRSEFLRDNGEVAVVLVAAK